MGHVVVPEPSHVRVPLCYFAFRGAEFIRSCKIYNLLFLKSLVMERILSSELSLLYFSAVIPVIHEITEFFPK